jgi:hypothetical protein
MVGVSRLGGDPDPFATGERSWGSVTTRSAEAVTGTSLRGSPSGAWFR